MRQTTFTRLLSALPDGGATQALRPPELPVFSDIGLLGKLSYVERKHRAIAEDWAEKTRNVRAFVRVLQQLDQEILQAAPAEEDDEVSDNDLRMFAILMDTLTDVSENNINAISQIAEQLRKVQRVTRHASRKLWKKHPASSFFATASDALQFMADYADAMQEMLLAYKVIRARLSHEIEGLGNPVSSPEELDDLLADVW